MSSSAVTEPNRLVTPLTSTVPPVPARSSSTCSLELGMLIVIFAAQPQRCPTG